MMACKTVVSHLRRLTLFTTIVFLLDSMPLIASAEAKTFGSYPYASMPSVNKPHYQPMIQLSQMYKQVPPRMPRRPINEPSESQNTQEAPIIQEPSTWSSDVDNSRNSVELLKQKTKDFYMAMIRGNVDSVLSFYDQNMNKYFREDYPSRSFIENDALKYFSRWARRSGDLIEISYQGYDRSSGGEHIRLIYQYSYVAKSGRNLSGISSNDIVWTSSDGTPKIKSIQEHVERYDR